MLDAIRSFSIPSLIGTLIAVLAAYSAMPLFRNRFKPHGKVAYVTGGNSGLGRAVAVLLVRMGASVTIVARDAKRLAEVEAELRALCGAGQVISAVSADITTSESAEAAFKQAVEHQGRCPDYVFNCAGWCKPRYFIDATPEQLRANLEGTYWIQAWTAHTACKAMIANRVKGSIIFTGSFLGYSSFVGYTPYAPGKYALRGLADSLRSEMLLHDIKVHMFMPAGIDSPGLVTEQETKPAPTKKLEEGDQCISPEVCAGHLIRGLQRGYYQPTTYFITNLMRAGSKGGVPGNNPLMDFIWWIVSGIGMPIWVFFMDMVVKGYKKDVQADLESRGFYIGNAATNR